jgi:DNA-binding MarR family transcriptional regulator
MKHLFLKELPKYEHLLEASQQYPELDPSAMEVYLYLLRAGDESVRVKGDIMERHNLSAGRFSVLMALIDKGPSCSDFQNKTAAQLAEEADVTRATMTGLIDTLEKDGYVKRYPHPEDRRAVIVKITEAGEAVMHSTLPDFFRIKSRLMETLSQDERKTLVSLLSKIIENAEKMPSKGQSHS